MDILGLQIDRPFLRASLIQKMRKGFKIVFLKSALLSEPENVKQLYKGKFKGRVVSGLSSKDLMLRPMELNIKNPRHAEAALLFQSEGITHISPADAISIPHSIKKAAGKVEASFFTASREAIKMQLEEFEKLQVDLDCVSSNGLALVHFAKWKAAALSDAFIVDLGSSEWSCALMECGELKKSHALNFGTEGLLATLWEDRKKIVLPKEVEGIAKQIDLQQIKANLNPHLSAKLSEMRQELSKVIFSFHRIANQKPILFTGHIDAFGHLREYLIEGFKEAVTKEFDEGFDLEERKYAISIGLALEQAGRPLQLLIQEFFPKKNWHRAGSYAWILLFLSIALSILFLNVGLYTIGARKKTMMKSVQTLVESWDPELKKLLLQNEEAALEKWISDVEANNKEYPYILDIPRVAEVLSWMDRQILLQEFKLEKDPLEVRELQYQLVEYPKIGFTQNRYRAKVELQFKIKSPMNARKFHEYLLKGDEIIDSSSEISWEALHDSYKTSFFLKHTKSPYVP